MKTLLKLAVVGFVLFVVIGMVASINKTKKPRAPDQPVNTTGDSFFSVTEPVVTMDEYRQLKNGISYDEAVRIIGSAGEEMSSNTIDGVPGVMPSVTTIMYSWQNDDASNMNAMFQNDKLTTKAQFGLK